MLTLGQYLGFIRRKMGAVFSFPHERHLEDPDTSLIEAEL